MKMLPDDPFSASRLVLATSLIGRLRGLLFSEETDAVIMLAPCRDIHTFGIKYALDVAFVDAGGQIIEVDRDVLPKRRLRNGSAAAVLERRAIPREVWFEEGERISLGALDEVERMPAGDFTSKRRSCQTDD